MSPCPLCWEGECRNFSSLFKICPGIPAISRGQLDAARDQDRQFRVSLWGGKVGRIKKRYQPEHCFHAREGRLSTDDVFCALGMFPEMYEPKTSISFLPPIHPDSSIFLASDSPTVVSMSGEKGDSRGGKGGRGKERLTLTDAAASHFPFPSFSAHLSQANALLHLLPIRAKVQKMSYPIVREQVLLFMRMRNMFRNRYVSHYSPVHILQDMLFSLNFLNPVAEKGGQACNKCQGSSQDSKNLLGERDLSPSAPTQRIFLPFLHIPPRGFFFAASPAYPTSHIKKATSKKDKS